MPAWILLVCLSFFVGLSSASAGEPQDAADGNAAASVAESTDAMPGCAAKEGACCGSAACAAAKKRAAEGKGPAGCPCQRAKRLREQRGATAD